MIKRYILLYKHFVLSTVYLLDALVVVHQWIYNLKNKTHWTDDIVYFPCTWHGLNLQPPPPIRVPKP